MRLSVLTSLAARLRPFAPVGGTICAASPSRKIGLPITIQISSCCKGRPVETKLAVATLENVTDEGAVGLTYIKGLDVNERFATPFQSERDGMQTVSLRGAGSLGIVRGANIAFTSERLIHHSEHGTLTIFESD